MANEALTVEDRSRTEYVIEQIYDTFDADDNGCVNFSDLTSGLSILCKGDADTKVRSTFKLYDADGDGKISRDEMEAYLTSVFKLIYRAQPGAAEEVDGVSPELLAEIMAEQAFQDADFDGDGFLSFPEFRAWYLAPDQAALRQQDVVDDIPDQDLAAQDTDTGSTDSSDSDSSDSPSETDDENHVPAAPSPTSLQQARIAMGTRQRRRQWSCSFYTHYYSSVNMVRGI